MNSDLVLSWTEAAEVTVYEGEPILVEVKATTGNTKSAKTILKNREQYGVKLCVKLSDNNIEFDRENEKCVKRHKRRSKKCKVGKKVLK